ncbi:TetR/AcrR family transcriptional regulator [Tsukamurella ocularis]|uniref:TetR/AcrR family transcriptional regulator n=1 Tax=Tsukamurella ocularis TaxID=1970234 RepID=UPI002167AFFB|nr:TetR/AcrR family transcriptional regulator [Tsukamurella ocularis]MCS3780735.1 AcrR family transcriptional regulator [Tsukamurella ocularis]MCS3786559.1 AcrR family transcriptional regulator [Tsukamurella ocularis]MCS3850401.1 AcrR family transcriptional regulator [Tsukamurella ocularis]
MPRGVAIDGARQRLFSAAEAVILRDGVVGLKGRAVTAQAGVATGLLHAHFGDFEGFLAAYAVDRSFALGAEAAEATPSGIGAETSVVEAICTQLDALPQSAATAFARLLAARPDLRERAAEVLGADSAGFEGVTAAVAELLEAEEGTGRLRAGTHPGDLAYAVVGAALRAWCAGDPDERWHGAVVAIIGAVASARPTGR